LIGSVPVKLPVADWSYKWEGILKTLILLIFNGLLLSRPGYRSTI